MGCSYSKKNKTQHNMEKRCVEFGSDDIDEEQDLIIGSKDTDSKSEENKDDWKEISIKELENVDEKDILGSVNQDHKNGEFHEIDVPTQKKYLNFICYKNQHWLSCDQFYHDCCSNLMQSVKENFKDENTKTGLQNIIKQLQQTKASLKSKTHQKCSKIKETISKDKKFTQNIFNDMINCFHKMLMNFLNELFKMIYELARTAQKLTITAVDIYHLLQSLPILKHILPKTIPNDDVLPPKDGFYNWALNVEYKTNYMPLLTTVNDVQEFIKKCNQDKKQCRFVSYGHSFSPVFGDEGTYTGLIIDNKYRSVDPPLDSFTNLKYENDFNKISVEDRPLMFVEISEKKNNQIRVGGAASNVLYTDLQRTRYFDHNHLETPSEPCNTLQHFQGYGGTHAVACHGAGINTTNLHCYIKELKILDASGTERVYNKEEDLKVIAAHLGLLGFVTEMTLQYDQPYYALFNPRSENLATYLPRNGECQKFQDDVSNNYYNEFFWFPTQKNFFINCWKRTFENNNPNEVEKYPPPGTELSGQVEEYLLQTFNAIFPITQCKGTYAKIFQSLVTTTAQLSLPSMKTPKKIISSDALHFIWGIQNMRALMMEWGVPLRKLMKDGKEVLVDGKTVPDCRRARDLVWACYDLVEEYKKKDCYPQLLPLELRIIRGNDYDRNYGSNVDFVCTIEVLTIVGTKNANQAYYDYCQELTDKWASIVGEDSKFMRPHWGKLWQNFTFMDKSMLQHFKETYGDQWKKFEEYRVKHDPNGIFLNNAFRTILGL